MMARGKEVVLETRKFANQTLASAFFKEMLNRYIPGDCVMGQDANELAALLKRHSEYLTKVGCGIDHFEVMAADYGTQCFCVVRKDGSREDFSYKHCIDQRPR